MAKMLADLPYRSKVSHTIALQYDLAFAEQGKSQIGVHEGGQAQKTEETGNQVRPTRNL